MPTLQVAIDSRLAQKGAADYVAGGKAIQVSSAQTARAVGTVDAKMKTMGATATRSKVAMVGLFGAFVAFAGLKTAISTIGDFEQTMAVVGNVTQGTTKQMEQMEAVARTLGATTRFTASEAGEGMLALARAGFEAEEAMAAVGSTLDLAQAGMIGLGEAAGFAANIVRQFGLEAEEVTRVANTLVFVSNSTNTNVRQLAEAMKFAGPIANALGLDLENTAAAIGVLGDRGIQASMAGTNMRGMMIALTAPTEKIERTLNKLGLTFADIDPVTNDFIDTMELLGDKLLGATEANQIFGRRNTAGAIILAQNTDALRELVDTTREQDEAARKAAQTIDETLNGAFKSWLSAIQENFLALGDQGLTGGLTNFVRWMTTATRILAGLEDKTTKGAHAARALAEALRFALIAGTALVTVKLARWLTSLALSTKLAAVTMIELRGVTVATAITMGTSGKLMAGIVAITGGLRALAVAIKGFFLSLGPAGWLILGITIAAEALLMLSRSNKQAAEEAEAYSKKLVLLRQATVDVSAAAERFETIQLRLARATERGDLQGQLQEVISMRRTIEDQIIELQQKVINFNPFTEEATEARGFDLTGFDELERSFFTTATVSVEKLQKIFGEAGKESLEAFLKEFAEGSRRQEAEMLNSLLPPGMVRRTNEQLRLLAAQMQESGELGFLDQGLGLPKEFTAEDVTKIPVEDAIRLLGEQSEITMEQITALRDELAKIASEEAQKASLERLEKLTAGFAEQTRLIKLERESFQGALTPIESRSVEDVSKALRVANEKREVALVLASARAQALKDEVTLEAGFFVALEKSVRAMQDEARAFEDNADAIKDSAAEKENELNKRDRAIASLDSMLLKLENENKLIRENATDREVNTALIQAEALAYGLTKEELDEYLKSIENVIRLKQAFIESTKKASSGLDEFLASLRRENDMLALNSGERAVEEALTRARAIAKREEIELTEAMAEALTKEVIERQRLERTLEGSQAIEGLTESLEREFELLGLTNNERELAVARIEAMSAAQKAFGENTEEAENFVENYLEALGQLQQLREMEFLANDMGQAFADAFQEFSLGAATAEEAAENLAIAVQRLIFEQFVTKPLADFASGIVQSFLPGPQGGGGLDPQELLTKQMEQQTALTMSVMAPILQQAASLLLPGATILQSAAPLIQIGATLTQTAGSELLVAATALIAAASSLQAAAFSSFGSAKGNIFSGSSRLQSFAQGGFPGIPSQPGIDEIIDSPITFPTPNGPAEAGEAGPEWAIAPLTRMPGGRLGVDVREGGQAVEQHIHNHFTQHVHGVRDADSFRKSRRQIVAAGKNIMDRSTE